MRLNGWQRLLLVLSVVWTIVVGVRAYAEYPDSGRFGGIPLGPFTFWSVVETSLGQDDRGNLLSSYTIQPRLGSFAIHGVLPIALFWLSLVATRWVRRGFDETKRAPSEHGEERLIHRPSNDVEPALSVSNAAERQRSQEIADGKPPAYLLLLRIIRGIFGFVGGWQVVGLLPALSLLGNPDALAHADLGKLAAVALVKVVFALIFLAIFFGLRSAINKAHFKHCGIPHPALKRTWSL